METKMLSIRNGGALSRALASPIDERIKDLLELRSVQLGGDITDQAHFAIVQPADNETDLARTIGFSIRRNPADGSLFGDPNFSPGWEWIEDHGFCFEFVFIMDDSGFGHVVIVPKCDGVDGSLLAFCAAYTTEHA